MKQEILKYLWRRFDEQTFNIDDAQKITSIKFFGVDQNEEYIVLSHKIYDEYIDSIKFNKGLVVQEACEDFIHQHTKLIIEQEKIRRKRLEKESKGKNSKPYNEFRYFLKKELEEYTFNAENLSQKTARKNAKEICEYIAFIKEQFENKFNVELHNE